MGKMRIIGIVGLAGTIGLVAATGAVAGADGVKNSVEVVSMLKNEEIFPPADGWTQEEELKSLKKELDTLAETAGADSEEYLTALDFYGDALIDTEQYEKGLEVKKKCLDLTGKLFGTEGKEYIRSLYDYSLAAYLGHRYNDAKQAALKAASMGEKLLTAEAKDYLKNKLEIAKIYTTYEAYPDAARIGHEILNEFPGLNPVYLRDISTYLKNNDEFIEAERVLDAAIGKLDPQNEKERVQYYIAISTKSLFLSETGRYMDAIQLVENEIANVTPDERVYSLLLTNLAGLYQTIGNIRRSAQLSRERWERDMADSGQEIPEAVRKELECEERGVKYQPTAEDYASLLSMSDEMLRELDDLGMQESEDYADILKSEASTYLLSRDYDKGLDRIEKAINVLGKVKGEGNSDYADYLEIKAMLLYGMERYNDSFPIFERVRDLRKSLYGEGNRSYISTLPFVAVNGSKTGNKKIAALTEEAAGAMNKAMRDAFISLSPTERNMYWENKSSWYTISLPSITYKNPKAGLEGTLYDGLLLSKGVLLNTELEQTALLKGVGSEEINNIYYALHSARKKLSDSTNLSAVDRDSLEQKAIRLERELTARSKEFGDYTKSMGYGWKDVRDNLGAEDLAIEFVEIPTSEDTRIMGALLLKKGFGKPKLVEIIDATSPWLALKDELKGCSRIFFSPAGEVYASPIEYSPEIPLLTGNEGTQVYRLSSTRMLIPGSNVATGTGALLYGDIAYDLGIEEVKADMQVNGESVERFRGNDNPLITEDTERGAKRGYAKLPETKKEVENIYATLGAEQAPHLVLRTGKEATEADFKRNSGDGFQMIHLATHGYYVAPAASDASGSSRPDAETDALKRCGLVMAGANSALHDKQRILEENIDDGTLTGEEISRLDMRGVELVSLSACETALGDRSYDGVMGLQRGFKKAGVKSLLMSLRKVSDTAASIFMTEFYRSLKDNGNKVEALSAARRALADYTDASGLHPYADPKYSDAFILLDAL